MKYITPTEANTYLETSGQDALVDMLIEQASEIVNKRCNVDSFAADDPVENERHDYNGNGPYYLKRIPVNSITHINGSAVNYTEGVHYLLKGRRIDFASTLTLQEKSTERPIIEFTYTCGYSNIPTDIKTATHLLVAGLYAKRKAQGVQSYTQGDIAVTFAQKDFFFGDASEQYSLFASLLAPYRLIDIYSN